MARSQAANLSGMLGSIGDTLGKMGDTGNQYVNTFRRLQAPKTDMNDSASLLAYADWARRNGYDDEAKQYMVLGASQQKLEGEKAYKDQLATGTEKLRGLYGQLARAKATPNADPNAVTGIQAQIDTVEATLNEAGAASIYGVANAGSVAGQTVTSEMLAQQRTAVEMDKLATEAALKGTELDKLVQSGDVIRSEDLPFIDYKEYQAARERATAAGRGAGGLAEINRQFRAKNDGLKQAAEKENKTIANGQVQVIFRDLEKEGERFINDDDLTDFLQDMTEDQKKAINEIVISKAIIDDRWINGDAETQREVVKEHFIDQYSQHFREDFGGSLANRQAASALEKSDAEADYQPGMNPDIQNEDGTPNAFEAWYADRSALDPTYTREEAREDWDKQFRRTSSKEPKIYRKEKGIPGLSDAYDKADANYNRFLENMKRRRAENANR